LFIFAYIYTAGRSSTLLDWGPERLYFFICRTNSVAPLEHSNFVLLSLSCRLLPVLLGTGPLASHNSGCGSHQQARVVLCMGTTTTNPAQVQT